MDALVFYHRFKSFNLTFCLITAELLRISSRLPHYNRNPVDQFYPEQIRKPPLILH